MVNLIKFLPALLAPFLAAGVQAGGDIDVESIEQLYGGYKASAIERYRGGLTSQQEAFERKDSLVSVHDDDFLFWDGEGCENPAYEISYHAVGSSEGNVPVNDNRYSNFYGYGVDRELVKTLQISCQENDETTYLFEIVGDELWLFLDGWFYRLEKTANE